MKLKSCIAIASLAFVNVGHCDHLVSAHLKVAVDPVLVREATTTIYCATGFTLEYGPQGPVPLWEWGVADTVTVNYQAWGIGGPPMMWYGSSPWDGSGFPYYNPWGATVAYNVATGVVYSDPDDWNTDVVGN